jgi:hypothetical protein
MPIRLSAPIEKTFTLAKTDILLNNTGEPTTVTIRQATQRQFERRADAYADLKQRVSTEDPEATEYITRFSQFELMRIEASLTVVGCNILGSDGEPLFKFRQDSQGRNSLMDDAAFTRAWGELPPDVADEIWEKVREVNIRWKPQGEVL